MNPARWALRGRPAQAVLRLDVDTEGARLADGPRVPRTWDAADADWAPLMRAAVQAGAPQGLQGRAVAMRLDDRLSVPGVLQGPLWRLRSADLQAAAQAWFGERLDAAEPLRVRAVLQRDGRHALACAVPKALVQAAHVAVQAEGGRLVSVLPNWVVALVAGEKRLGWRPAVLACAGPELAAVTLALYAGGAWVDVSIEDVDTDRHWARRARAFTRRALLDPATAAAVEGPRTASRRPHSPRRLCVLPDASPLPGPEWTRLAAAVALPVRSPAWSAARLDFVDAAPPRPRLLEHLLAGTGAVVLAASVWAGQQDYRWLQELQSARAAQQSLHARSARADAAAAPSVPVPVALLQGVATDLQRPWLPLLDRLAEIRDPGIEIHRIEPVLAATGQPARVKIGAGAPGALPMAEWVGRLAARGGFVQVQLLGWQARGEDGTVQFDVEVLTDVR